RQPRDERAVVRIGGLFADRDDAVEADVVRDPEQHLELRNGLARYAVDPRPEPLGESGELDQHEERSRVDVPVGRRPGDLLTVDKLVLLLVALMVARLAHA